ncbi:MAG: ABC transporter substrate-binding protein [bacterium]
MNSKLLKVFLVMSLFLAFSLVSVAEEVTLRYSWWGSQDRHDYTMELIELFEEKYPNIKIQPEFTGFGPYWDRLDPQMAAGNLPDVLTHVDRFMSGYVQGGHLLELTPYIESGQIETDKIPDSLVKMGYFLDGQYAMATGVNAPAVYYDKELFDKAGIDYPSPDRTWEDELALLKELHDELGILGAAALTAQTDSLNGFVVYLRQHGEDLYNEEITELGFSDHLYVEFMEMTLEAIKSGAVRSAAARAETDHEGVEQDPITRQEAAMATNYWSNQLGALANASGKVLGMTTMPTAKNQVEEGRFMRSAMLYAISANTEHPEEALTFLNFMVNDEDAAKLIGTDRGVPIQDDIRNMIAENASEVDQAIFDFIDIAAETAGEPLVAQPPVHEEVLDVFEEAYWEVIYEEISPEDAVKTIKRRGNRILANQ